MAKLNKCAMIGLFRTLKKQFTGLFLAKRHSVDLQETRGSHKTKRGAMFGLDARIALAIFGALSVISGAALYSAIKEVKVVSAVTFLDELGKAFVAYYLDMGSLPSYDVDSASVVHSKLLNTSSATGWKGPYTSLVISATHSVYPDVYGGYMVVRLGDRTSANSTQRVACTVKDPKDKDCSIWAEWYTIPQETAEAIDLKVDGTADLSNGRVRYCPPCGTVGSMFYRLDAN